MFNESAEYHHRDIRLQEDDNLMGFKKGDRVVVDLRVPPTSGQLVVITDQDRHFICRYENIDGKKFLWPPRGFDPSDYDRIILGQAVELTRSLG